LAELSGRHVLLPQSRLPIVAEPDVLVVGGGSAGLAAATAVKAGVGVKEIDVPQLQERLRRQGAIVE
jgi:ribulose 1,5-bisphosphate synthetase/thiazole synthase